MTRLTDLAPGLVPTLEDTNEYLEGILALAKTLLGTEPERNEMISRVEKMLADNKDMITWAKEAMFVEAEDIPTYSN